jgi:GMP synthase-like glutamine amidotransferase
VARALVLQHQDDCPPGLLGTWAAARGVQLDVVRPDRGDRLPSDAQGHDAVVVLGSDKSVNDDVPWIIDELAWLREVAAASDAVPVLGVCFGSQALAVALGGEVRREAPEIAWQPIEVNGSEPEIETGPWLCWHNDFITMNPSPPTRELARSARALQAFAHGRHLAIQFHPEVTPAIVADWMGADDLGRDLARAGVNPGDLAAQTAAHAGRAAECAHRLFDSWATHARLS